MKLQRRVELIRWWGAEDVLERRLEGHVLTEVAVGQVDEGVTIERAHPCAVVEYLRHDVARRPVPLELQHVKVALAVHGEEIDDLAERRPHLPPDDEQPLAEQRRILLQVLLQRRLGRQRRRGEPPRRVPVDPPHPHLHRHGSQPSRKRSRLQGRRKVRKVREVPPI